MADELENWYRLTLLVDAAGGDHAAAILWEHEVGGVEMYDAETYAEDQSIPPVPDGTNRLIAYIEQDSPEQAEQSRDAIVASLTESGLPPISVQFGSFTDTSWQTAWKDFFKPTVMSKRAIVGPPWEEFEAPEGGTKIVIEPGMAFGTGTHETTQLCGEKIDRLLGEADSPQSLLDVGCGSAILSMIAARLGAAPVFGVDNDAHAVEVAKENLEVNQLGGAIDLSTRELSTFDETFDIVVANILTPILISLRDDLIARVRPGGTLLLSGITDVQVDSIREAFVGSELRELDLAQKGEWVCFELQRVSA
ncbi:50S ribosomal protein L11 methyltransferase [Bradymonas sediminis]|uniref:Ribosomal protein L11 methyltransferase n=1 Tax=Bradymonas sediminis TaxID=1548548 RepID=A0A2Z4FJV1_9DELT|nr:50S ribosomal protein L11 methyltransferase [Bradymonas sediminis]AWV89241.1 50S ribosomal protein L11 methyltransferase [Bradymonas sediminis]TDP73410.1 ribosomal protein L11 methyltransferase [Bradymonas sediminis]